MPTHCKLPMLLSVTREEMPNFETSARSTGFRLSTGVERPSAAGPSAGIHVDRAAVEELVMYQAYERPRANSAMRQTAGEYAPRPAPGSQACGPDIIGRA